LASSPNAPLPLLYRKHTGPRAMHPPGLGGIPKRGSSRGGQAGLPTPPRPPRPQPPIALWDVPRCGQVPSPALAGVQDRFSRQCPQFLCRPFPSFPSGNCELRSTLNAPRAQGPSQGQKYQRKSAPRGRVPDPEKHARERGPREGQASLSTGTAREEEILLRNMSVPFSPRAVLPNRSSVAVHGCPSKWPRIFRNPIPK